MNLLRIVGVLFRTALLISVLETHYGDNAIIKDVVYPVEEKVNEALLVPAVSAGVSSLCRNIPRLCPTNFSDKFTQTLTEEKTTVAEKRFPEITKSPKKCVVTEEIPTIKMSSDDQADQMPRKRPGLLLAKFGKASVEDLGNYGTELNREDLENVPYGKIEPTLINDEQTENSPKEYFQEGNFATSNELEVRGHFCTKSGWQNVYMALALVAGGLASLVIILINISLIITSLNVCQRRIGEETIETLGKMAKKSTKQVQWLDLQSDKSKEATANATSGPDRASQAAAGRTCSLKMKTMGVLKRIQRVFVNLTTRCQRAICFKKTALPGTTRGNQTPPIKEQSCFSIDTSDDNDGLDIQPVACFAVNLNMNSNENDSDEIELNDIDDLFVPLCDFDCPKNGMEFGPEAVYKL